MVDAPAKLPAREQAGLWAVGVWWLLCYFVSGVA